MDCTLENTEVGRNSDPARKETNLGKTPYSKNSMAKIVHAEEEWTAVKSGGTIARHIGMAFGGVLTMSLKKYMAAEKGWAMLGTEKQKPELERVLRACPFPEPKLLKASRNLCSGSLIPRIKGNHSNRHILFLLP